MKAETKAVIIASAVVIAIELLCFGLLHGVLSTVVILAYIRYLFTLKKNSKRHITHER